MPDAFDEGLVFLGSRQSDSALIRWLRPFDPILSKRVKLEDEEENFLYGHEEAKDSNQSAPTYKVVEVLPCFAPIVDFEFSDSLCTAPRNVQVDAEAEDQVTLKLAEDQAQELIAQGKYSAAATTRARAQNTIAERRKARAIAPVPRDLDLVVSSKTPCRPLFFDMLENEIN